jgi:hypothetical protein
MIQSVVPRLPVCWMQGRMDVVVEICTPGSAFAGEPASQQQAQHTMYVVSHSHSLQRLVPMCISTVRLAAHGSVC